MGILQKIRCWMGYHQRSQFHARMGEDRRWRSRCKGCGTRMQWIGATDQWVTIDEARPAVPSGQRSTAA